MGEDVFLQNWIQLPLFSRIDGGITGGFNFKSTTLLCGYVWFRSCSSLATWNGDLFYFPLLMVYDHI